MDIEEISKALANGVSRRRALRLFGGALAGGLLAGAGALRVLAAPNPCAVYCTQLGLKGAAKASCQQACKRCDADFQRICQGPGSFSCCSESEFCAPSGQCESFQTCEAGSGCFGPFCAPECFCVDSVEGDPACVSQFFANCEAQTCTTSADCGAGGICVDASECCGTPDLKVCFPAEAMCTPAATSGVSAPSVAWRH